MYHYIRDYNKAYPYFNNLSKDEFKRQLIKFNKEYGIIENISELSKKNKKVLLTFDDGFKDHFFAAKELSKINKIGIFFANFTFKIKKNTKCSQDTFFIRKN